jgi:hypothetical protein
MTKQNNNQTEDELIYQKLNLETGKIGWPELQRHFARGVIIIVAKELDLVEVAQQFSLNQKDAVQKWIDQGLIRHANDDDAIEWNNVQQQFWAVVAAPWVLVQIID